jgi:hypothetical protein
MGNGLKSGKIIAVLCIILILITSSFSMALPFQFLNKPFLKTNQQIESEEIKQITPKDDAFHGTTSIPTLEWWYFDCMLEDNYSAHIGFRIITYNGLNILKPSINIYHGTDIVANETIFLLPHQFTVSTEYPEIIVGNKQVMLFDQSSYEQSNQWKYEVSYSINDVGVDLTFTNETMGWKYQTLHEGWTVAIPKGIVKGTLRIGGENISVEGRGYHDHNWNFSIKTPARGWSWYWGKITGDSLNLAWAVIKDTGILEQTFRNRLGVFNPQQEKFIVIDPNNIVFSADSYILKDNRFIPTSFQIIIEQDDIFIDVTLSSVDIHLSDPTFLTIHYWRYFVEVTGEMRYKDKTEQIDEKIQIIEYMRFV